MKIIKIIFLIMITDFCFSASFVLKNGQKIEGEVVSESMDSFNVKIPYGKLSIRKNEIVSVSGLESNSLWKIKTYIMNLDFDKASDLLLKIKKTKFIDFTPSQKSLYKEYLDVCNKEKSAKKSLEKLKNINFSKKNIQEKIFPVLDNLIETSSGLFVALNIIDYFMQTACFDDVLLLLKKIESNSYYNSDLLKKKITQKRKKFESLLEIQDDFYKLKNEYGEIKRLKWKYSNVLKYRQLEKRLKKLIKNSHSSRLCLDIQHLLIKCCISQAEYSKELIEVKHYLVLLEKHLSTQKAINWGLKYCNYLYKRKIYKSLITLADFMEDFFKEQKLILPKIKYRKILALIKLKNYHGAYKEITEFSKIDKNNYYVVKSFYKIISYCLKSKKYNKISIQSLKDVIYYIDNSKYLKEEYDCKIMFENFLYLDYVTSLLTKDEKNIKMKLLKFKRIFPDSVLLIKI